MSDLRVLIVDDEPLARARARRLLGDIGGAEVVGEAGSVPEARTAVADLTPDLLLLDVRMHDSDGFALIESLPEPRPLVVFTTAFDLYAVQAFEANAVDYLLKPIEAERLAAALAKVARHTAPSAGLSDLLRELLARDDPAPPLGPAFTVRTARGS
jgi:two-component system LytT family response regulator